jgi:hypothetical protein
MFDPKISQNLKRPEKILPGTKLLVVDSVFCLKNKKPVHVGERQTVCEVLGDGIRGFARIKVLACSGRNPFPVGSVIEKPIFNLLRCKEFSHEVKDGVLKLKSGGHLEGTEGGRKVVLDNAQKGGMSEGSKHSEGGIKGSVGTEERPIEFEGKEIILTAPVADNPKKYQFEGQELTGRDIASRINQDNGGVSFSKGGQTCSCSK